ncbi:MAG: primosomal protein N', partial [Proteobacteria bacterium]|nr:primosomal protein N' [Pseudomonadota bacterium]
MFARVAVARPLTGTLTYSVPSWLLDQLKMGHVVLVPLRGAAETGYVVSLFPEADLQKGKIKQISRLLDPLPAFDQHQLEFFEWIARYYLSPLGMVIQTALPSTIRAKVLQVLRATDEGVTAITDGEVSGSAAQVLREVISRPDLTVRGLVRRLDDELEAKVTRSAVDALLRRGLVGWNEREVGEMRGRVRTVTLKMPVHEALERLPRAGRRMRAIIDVLAGATGPLDQKALLQQQGSAARSALKRLEEADVVCFAERERRDELQEAPPVFAEVPRQLNKHQQVAFEALIADDAARPFLLFGVTGSGKTEVFLRVAQTTLARGRQVLVLVPEIGLTPQLVGRFRARLGSQVAVLHSGLTGAERLSEWRRIRAGDATVAIGARSALFAPFSDLGLIVVDEEHDDSYKQDEGVKYNARDLAVVLGKMRVCPVVLASATPALETWHNASNGRYALLRLPYRATPRSVPVVELIDLTAEERDSGESTIFASAVIGALGDTFSRGGKAIVLYNRRGYATTVQCTSCGGTYECPNCGITMTLHRRAWVVSCHYCGLKRRYSEACPTCETQTFEELGKGTERIEEELSRLFPEIPLARMDRDTTEVRGAHQTILHGFREGRTRLLVGTQIVA